MALEELVWGMRGSKLDYLADAARLLSVLGNHDTDSTIVKTYKSEDPNKHFLIGVLPRLFQDKKLFAQNEDIVDFAASALKLNMSRSEKRSRYEIIGKVICETDTLDEKQLTDLVRALEVLLNNRDKLEMMAEKKKSGRFSWNETIQELLGSR
ncbi:MAG TPA: hypothetical protein VF427_12845 [Noviherbaspirillum sp.]